MNKKFININIFYLILVILFSFFFNYFYANLGVFPIDTFAFLDTAYNIHLNRHPFKDIWVTTGPLVDYLQFFFFKLFGFNWSSYVIHASIINALVSYFFFKTLVENNLSKILCLIYALGLGVLCYTISGTPFAYIHSYSFSLLSILFFFNAIKFKSKKYFFFLPIMMSIAFLSMQNPAALIILVIFIFLIIFYFKTDQKKFIYFFIGGTIFSIISFLLILFFNKIPLINFFQQYFLFPLTMGENRVLGNEMAHISLSERATFRNVLGHFKFINVLIIILIYITIRDFFKKSISFENFIINFSLILCSLMFIFNQLITSNQTYIFSLIPFLAGFIHLNLNEKKNINNIYKNFVFLLMIFCVLKYHFVYNEKRKFMDLQNVNLQKTVDAKVLDPKFRGLKWISPKFPDNPIIEINFLREAVEHIKSEKEEIMLMTDYQFFSFLTEKNLNIPNRWYTHDNNSYPLEDHKYFKFYKHHINKTIEKNKIFKIYTIGEPNIENFKIYFKDKCFKTLEINEITKVSEIVNCN